VSDINTAVVDSLKVLDPNRPIREADKRWFLAIGGLSAYDPRRPPRKPDDTTSFDLDHIRISHLARS
jgi:hypothetical protein